MIVVLLGVMAYALAEDLTLTTYYPSPRGVYQELRTTGDVAIGTTSAPAARLEVRGAAGDGALALAVVTPADRTRLLIPTSGELLLGVPRPPTAPAQFGVFRAGPETTPEACAVWMDEDGDDTFDLGECKAPSFLVTPTGQVGIGTTSPAAALEVVSKTGGFLPPRMMTTERNALTTGLSQQAKQALEGLVVYNTEMDQLEVYDGSEWKSISAQSHDMVVVNGQGSHEFIPAFSRITVEVWGGGGGSGKSHALSPPNCVSAGGGGGGGYGKQVLNVSVGIKYVAYVGAGGYGPNNFGNPNGEPSYFRRDDSTIWLVSADGGQGGDPSNGGSGGLGHADFSVNGEAGKSGYTGRHIQSGGDSYCAAMDGPDTICAQVGDGGAGGNGGAGGTGEDTIPVEVTVSGSGAVPGGGGAGLCRMESTVYPGGDGRVVISW